MERIKQNEIDLPSSLPNSSFFFISVKKKPIVFLSNVVDSLYSHLF